MTDAELAYLAGFIDGEGCITMVLHKHSKRYGLAMDIVLIITNTDNEVLQWIKDKTGVGRVVLKRNSSKTYKTCWAYTLTENTKLIPLLKSVQPFIIVKRDQVVYALNFLQSRDGKNKRESYSRYEMEQVFKLRMKTQVKASDKLFYRKVGYSLDELYDLVAGDKRCGLFVWTIGAEALLGTDYDINIATKLGTCRAVVCRRRNQLHIPAFGNTRPELK